MSCASPVESLVVGSEPAPSAAPLPVDTHALGESIAALAARLHAATYELLVMLAEFDARKGWNTGFLSCAHWLHWRTGIDLGAAREKVRVARALPALTRISERMQAGQLSYAKVRALTRVATPGNEQALLNVALAGTAAQVERFVRAWRRVDRVAEAKHTETRHLRRRLSMWLDDDGMVVVRGRLSPEVGAVVQRALEAAADQLFRDQKASPTGDTMAEEVSHGQRRADALALLAETALSAGLDAGTAGDRYQVVVHVSADDRATDDGDDGGVVELDHGALRVSAETSRRLACDASVVQMRHGDDDRVLDVGRKTRSIPPAIRRALAARDSGCRFPGCTARRCDAHHVAHWADGGATRLDNLMLLCRRHHRAVHEGGFRVIDAGDGRWTFIAPTGAALPSVPAQPVLVERLEPAVDLAAAMPVWDGTPLDLVWAIDVLWGNDETRRSTEQEEDGGGSCGNRSVVSKELVGAALA